MNDEYTSAQAQESPASASESGPQINPVMVDTSTDEGKRHAVERVNSLMAAKGVSPHIACQAIGISESQYYFWKAALTPSPARILPKPEKKPDPVAKRAYTKRQTAELHTYNIVPKQGPSTQLLDLLESQLEAASQILKLIRNQS